MFQFIKDTFGDFNIADLRLGRETSLWIAAVAAAAMTLANFLGGDLDLGDALEALGALGAGLGIRGQVRPALPPKQPSLH